MKNVSIGAARDGVEPVDASDNKYLAYAFLVFSAAMFASGYPLARAVVPEAGIEMLITQGMLVGAVLLTMLGGGKNSLSLNQHGWPIFFNGVGTALTSFLVMEGSRLITPALASVIVISNAIMIAAMAWALGRKSFRPAQTVALTAGFLGVVWVSVERGAIAGEALGVAYLTTAAVGIALITVVIEKPLAEAGGLYITKWIFWVAFATSLLAVTVTGRLHFHSLEQTGIAAFFGAVSIGAPALMYNVAMSRVGSADAAAFKLLIPVFAFIYGVTLLGEIPNASSMAGGLLVIASVAIYQTAGADRKNI